MKRLFIFTLISLFAIISVSAKGEFIYLSDGNAVYITNGEIYLMAAKVKIVESFPDLKVQVVKSFPDVKIKIINERPDKGCEWQIVESFPDYKIQFVESFPDIKFQFVKSFPGIPVGK